jgi:hypothetical protein
MAVLTGEATKVRCVYTESLDRGFREDLGRLYTFFGAIIRNVLTIETLPIAPHLPDLKHRVSEATWTDNDWRRVDRIARWMVRSAIVRFEKKPAPLVVWEYRGIFADGYHRLAALAALGVADFEFLIIRNQEDWRVSSE